MHVRDEQHKIMSELKSNKTFFLKCPLITSDGVPIILMYALLDGGWFVVGIGLFSNKLYLALQDFHENEVMKN